MKGKINAFIPNDEICNKITLPYGFVLFCLTSCLKQKKSRSKLSDISCAVIVYELDYENR